MLIPQIMYLALEKRSITEVLTPITPISEIVEDPINFIPPAAATRVPVLSSRLPPPEHNPACSYNSTCIVPLHNDTYTPVDFPVTTIKSVTLQAIPPYQPQTEPIHVEQTTWEQPLYQDTLNYPYSINNYIPVQTPFQYPWFSSNTTLLQNQTAPTNIYVREHYPSNSNKVYCMPCNQTY